MTPTERKRIEIDRKLEGFEDEFKRWKEVSKPDAEFQKHGSQVRSVEKLLGGFESQIREVVKQSANQPDQLTILAEMSKMTLALLGIWDFFRSKLEQRREPAFRQALNFADELAWVCYQPAHARGIKAPPLVFLNSGVSPFVLRRDVRFNAESLPRELVGSDTVTEATAHLPFPVIGVPWYQVDHLPDAVVIGHEVGHAVEADLKLTKDVKEAIKQALAPRPDISDRIPFWTRWRSELFADIYGCLATGPAFVGALGDFLAAPASEIQAERPKQSDYPPVAVRLRFNAAVLESMGFTAEAQAIWSDCEASWNPLPQPLQPYIEDAVVVAKQLITVPLPGLNNERLTKLLSFDQTQLKNAWALVDKAKACMALGPVTDLRTLFAAVRLAYEQDPRNYDQQPAGKSVLVRLTEALKAAVRDDYRAGEPVFAQPDRDKRDKALAEVGRQWFKKIRGSFSAVP